MDERLHGKLQSQAAEFKAWCREKHERMKKHADIMLEFRVTQHHTETDTRYDITSLIQHETGELFIETGTLELLRIQSRYELPQGALYEEAKPQVLYSASGTELRTIWEKIVGVVKENEHGNEGRKTISITGLNYFNYFYHAGRNRGRLEEIRITTKRIRTYCTHDIEGGSREFLELFNK